MRYSEQNPDDVIIPTVAEIEAVIRENDKVLRNDKRVKILNSGQPARNSPETMILMTMIKSLKNTIKIDELIKNRR